MRVSWLYVHVSVCVCVCTYVCGERFHGALIHSNSSRLTLYQLNSKGVHDRASSITNDTLILSTVINASTSNFNTRRLSGRNCDDSNAVIIIL